MQLSVIIPTYNRKNALLKCLHALFNQSYPTQNFEIIIVDDGSTDGTEESVKPLIEDSPCPLRYFSQKNKGPAATRNVGIRNAQGNILLIIGDDIIATSTLLDEHIKWHTQYPDDNVAVLGYVTWSSEIRITPFVKWLENGGPQFNYGDIKNKVEVDTQDFFFTCNISLKRKFLFENNEFFDEEFPYAAHEDIEFGYRLKKKGLILKYNKNAIGYHLHYTDLKRFCQRQRIVGRSRKIFDKKCPELAFPSSPERGSVKELIKRIIPLVRIFVSWLDKCNLPFPKYIYKNILVYYYFLGTRDKRLK